jgi:hypothetical protein
VNATDLDGNWDVEDNNSAYFQIYVVDIIAPSVVILTPLGNATVNGTTPISVSAVEEQSGLAYIEVYLGTALLANLTNAPYTYSWDTNQTANGDYILRVIAYDNAGNYQEQEVAITVLNVASTTPGGPAALDPMIFLIGGGVGAAIIVVVVIVFLQKRK